MMKLLVASLLLLSSAPATAFTTSLTSLQQNNRLASGALTPRPTFLLESTSPDDAVSSATEVDYDALIKYHGAVAVQMTLIAGVFKALDLVVDTTGIGDSIPTLALVPLFYALSLKSRAFNPLDNARPNREKAIEEDKPNAGFGDRIMPSWTPPGVVFPIMWLLIIGPLRAYSSALVWQADGHVFFHPALLALAFHLSVGDVWNTINNTEQRYGASVTAVLCVTTSALVAAVQYSWVDELAGNLLGLPMIWFSIATSLVAATWQLNPNAASGDIEPLYPTVRAEKTKIAWLESSSSE